MKKRVARITTLPSQSSKILLYLCTHKRTHDIHLQIVVLPSPRSLYTIQLCRKIFSRNIEIFFEQVEQAKGSE